MTANFPQGFPNISGLFCDAQGRLTPTAYRFLLSIYNRTGSGDGGNLPDTQALAEGALQKTANLSDVDSVQTSRTNLGLGTAATRAATNALLPQVVALDGAVTANHVAVFDADGSIKDGGTPAGGGTVTSVELASPSGDLTIGGTNPVVGSGTIDADLTVQGGLAAGTRFRPTFNTKGIATASAALVRKVTAAGAVTVTSADFAVIVDKTVAAATPVNLPAGFTDAWFRVKDGKGDADANPITVTPNGVETIDGAATLVLSNAYQAADLMWNGAEWSQF